MVLTTNYTVPLIKDDAVVFGILMLALGFVFYTSSLKSGFWYQFYKFVPALLMCYFIPAVFSTFGLISADEYLIIQNNKEVVKQTNVYYMASRYLLPAALVLMTLSMDIKAVFGLGSKALIMFVTGTVGIVIGGPIAIVIISAISPQTLNGIGFDAVWRGLATLAGSWIGGGANQTAMLEIFQYNQEKYGAMVLVDIVVANIWMAFLIVGIGKKNKIDTWLKADNSSIEKLKIKMEHYAAGVSRKATTTDLMLMACIAFVSVGVAHFAANNISDFLVNNVAAIGNKTGFLSSLGSHFFWMISISTLIGILLSYTPIKQLEGAGASKIGSVFIYILVATIGMKMNLKTIFENPGLIAIGLVWMAIHAGLLILVAKLIKAPYFFLAVGSQANVGGAASAPVVAAEFHPALATVGVLLAVFGYAVGTFGALLCAWLMEIASNV